MKLDFEYGNGLMSAELPDSTDVFIPGETVPDPPCIPEGEIVARTLESIRNPMGMKPLAELAHKGSTAVIVIPDIVKGGCQPTSHRKVSIRLIVDDLNRRLADRELSIELTPEAEAFVVENAYDPVYGARPLKRYIQKYVETLSAKLILSDQVNAKDVILITVEDGALAARRKV